MAYQDLRAFLTVLRQAGELVNISRPISLKYDVAKALAKSSSVQGPALLFESTGTAFPLVAGLYATRKRALMAFDATEASIHDKVLKGINNPVGPVDFGGSPPCQEVVLTGDQIDVTALPVPIYSPKDGGPFITGRHSGVGRSGNNDPRHRQLSLPGPRTKDVGRVVCAQPSLRQEYR